MDLGNGVGIGNPQEEQREEQRRQGKQEEQLADAQTRGGQGERKKEEKTDAEEGEETVDDKMSEESDVREMRGRFQTLVLPGKLREMSTESF